uniref:Uncharacterized protein n=1 Tax=Schistosoma curassoni TaxID=6186 RepID=A0A183JN70_9TREM
MYRPVINYNKRIMVNNPCDSRVSLRSVCLCNRIIIVVIPKIMQMIVFIVRVTKMFSISWDNNLKGEKTTILLC